jgi:FMN phosphatase YigB (HAD superfamily)
MGKSYRVLLFDCFNTVYVQDPSRVPRLELDGRSVPSTAGLLAERLRGLLPAVEPAAVYRAWRSAGQWAEAERGEALREVPAPRRFRRACQELGLPEADEALLHELLEVHMRALTGSFYLPEAHRTLLQGLRARHRLALFSNFDHAPALRRLLAETGIADWFDPVLISDGLGYRKPGRAAFAAALAALDEPPGAILFVGDSLEDDVRGCNGAGIDVAWLNAGGAPALADRVPTHELRALDDLLPLLE